MCITKLAGSGTRRKGSPGANRGGAPSISTLGSTESVSCCGADEGRCALSRGAYNDRALFICNGWCSGNLATSVQAERRKRGAQQCERRRLGYR
jgi:hypothetical protein